MTTSRGHDPGHRRQNVHNSGTRHRLRRVCQRCLRPDLLDNDVVLIVGRGLAPAAKQKGLTKLAKPLHYSLGISFPQYGHVIVGN